jgi:hypothetical protein
MEDVGPSAGGEDFRRAARQGPNQRVLYQAELDVALDDLTSQEGVDEGLGNG